jgi:large subunit ribosomal protein L10
VAKNSLLRRASAESGAAALADCFSGPTAVAYSFGDPVRLAKVLVDYAKENDKFTLKGGLMDGKPLAPAQIATLAMLPSSTSCAEARGTPAGARPEARGLAGRACRPARARGRGAAGQARRIGGRRSRRS